MFLKNFIILQPILFYRLLLSFNTRFLELAFTDT